MPKQTEITDAPGRGSEITTKESQSQLPTN